MMRTYIFFMKICVLFLDSVFHVACSFLERDYQCQVLVSQQSILVARHRSFSKRAYNLSPHALIISSALYFECALRCCCSFFCCFFSYSQSSISFELELFACACV